MSGNTKTEVITSAIPDGDWSWSRREESGYTYPPDAHAPVRNTPTSGGRHRRDGGVLSDFRYPILCAVVVSLGVVGLALASLGESTPPGGDTVTVGVPIASTLPLPDTGSARHTAPLPLPPRNPYTEAGRWLVGIDIDPGTYTVTVADDRGGYWARCADTLCEWGGGLIENAFLAAGSGPHTVVVDDTDHLFIHSGVTLEPTR